ncbi:MAG: GMC family oxidoreductase N-terminal domain-containing protein [Rubrivivax sp.]
MPEFDYVIVGAGSAGCVMAARLADGGHRVLLLEAGGSDRRLRVQVPIGYGLSFHDPRLNWRFHTEPEPSLEGRAGYWPRGKVLGGSSAINAMVWVRGLRSDYDRWRDQGNPGWGFDDVLPAFKRLESFAAAPDALRGHDGPVAVSDVSARVHPLCAHWLGAARDLGLPVNAGFNGASAEGLGLYEINVGAGLRQSAARAYLRPALRRGALQVRTSALAMRIELDQRRAVAVHYRCGGQAQRAGAAREVILCAGAVQSPLLLQASGVGPAEWLQALGIPVALHSPAVGRHLQDHLCVDHLFRARVPTLNEVLRPWSGRVRVALQYLLTRSGPLAMSVNQGGGFVRSGPDADEPDLQLYFSPLSYTRAKPGRRALMSPDPFPGFLLSAQWCRPTSRGQVRLRHPEGVDAPLIEPNSLATAQDLDGLVRGVRWLHRLAATPSLARVIDTPLQPGAADDDDGQVAAQVRRLAGTVFHACGTCRMGPEPVGAVVDARLRVHGLQGLRVVDAAVFPSIPSGNTNAPTMMVAEHAAAMVLADARAGG